jgi:hypothetical protein
MTDTAQQQPVSLRDELANSYDEQASPKPETDPPKTEPEKEIPEPEPENAAEEEEENEEQEEEQEEEPGKAKLPGALEAPSHWKAEDKAKFSKLPQEGREILLRRHKEMETDYIRKTQDLAVKTRDLAATKQFKDTVDHLLSPYRNVFATQGMDEIGGIRYLLGWYQNLQQNPEQTILSLAHQYGVQFTPKPGQQINPELAPILQELHSVKSQIAQERQAQQAAVSSSILQQVNSFASEANADGTPKHPHFETVRGDMAILIQNGRASTMDEAYGMALRLHPEIFDKQIEESILGKQKTTQQQEIDEAARKAAQAKKAAKGIKSGSANVDKAPAKTLRDDLSEIYDQQTAR